MKRGWTFAILFAGAMAAGLAFYFSQKDDKTIPAVLLKHVDPSGTNKQRDVPYAAELEKSRALLNLRAIRNKDGNMTAEIARSLSLTEQEQGKLREQLDALRNSISELARRNLANDAEQSDVKTGVTAYRISAFRDEGQQVFDAFKKEVSILLGASRMTQFLQLFPPHLYYGNMGANDMYFRFQEENVGDDTAVGLHYEEVNPLTGKVELKRVSEFGLVEGYLPDVFRTQVER